MADQQFLEDLKEGYRLWSASKGASSEQWLKMIADDVEWRSLAEGAPGMEFSGAAHGKSEVIRYFQELATEWEMLDYSMPELVCDGDRVVVMGTRRWRHRKTGKTMESPKVDILRIRDGKVVEFLELYDTAKAIAAATS